MSGAYTRGLRAENGGTYTETIDLDDTGVAAIELQSKPIFLV